MITGVVNARHEATIRLSVHHANGQEQEVEVILDTGFSGSLTLPPTFIAALGLPWRTRGTVILANGNEDQFDIYAAVIRWDGAAHNILVEAAALLFIWASILGHWSLVNAIIGLAVTGVGAIRIVKEEQVLCQRYPEYSEYSRNTKRVIPYLL